jgi:hypothetical protein
MSLPDDLVPTNTTYGSGEPIEPEVLEHIRESYADVGVRCDWQEADIMLIDNLLTAHAREPFEGDRRVLVGMGSAPERSPSSIASGLSIDGSSFTWTRGSRDWQPVDHRRTHAARSGDRAAAGELILARSRTVAFAQRRDLVHGILGEKLPAEPQLRLRRYQEMIPRQPAATAAGNVKQYDRFSLNPSPHNRVLQACDRYSGGRFYVYSL